MSGVFLYGADHVPGQEVDDDLMLEGKIAANGARTELNV